MSDIDEPLTLDDPDGPDFSLPDEMFRSGDNPPETIAITMWKHTEEGLEAQSTDAEYVEIDGLAIFEGDIVLGDIADVRAAKDLPAVEKKGIGIVGDQFRWGPKIGFIVEDNDFLRQKVELAIAHWEKHTPFRFIPRTPANEDKFRDFISFENRGVCQSHVGKQGGKQFISIGDSCSAGSAIHEIGHAIGLFHEQSRSDRDDFIQVVDANINAAARFNFKKQVQGAKDLGDYDYVSIMHYSSKAFSINGKPTIIPLQADKVIGQRTGLSKGDVEAVRSLYPTLKWSTVVPIQ